jgi:hypothetical protein
MYDRRMRTLLIVGRSPLPASLRDVVDRGSTSVVEKRAAELTASRPPADVDRVVLWTSPGDPEVADLARAYSRDASPEARDTLIVISPEPTGSIPGIPATDLFVWPRDEDRLRMAFMTGA